MNVKLQVYDNLKEQNLEILHIFINKLVLFEQNICCIVSEKKT